MNFIEKYRFLTITSIFNENLYFFADFNRKRYLQVLPYVQIYKDNLFYINFNIILNFF